MSETNVQKIYGGKLEFKFVEGNHGYYVREAVKEGKKENKWERKTGSTTIIGIKDKSTPLKYWVSDIIHQFLNKVLGERDIDRHDLDDAKGLHLKRLKAEATTGTKTHEWIELKTKGKKPAMPQEEGVLNGVNAFLAWEKKHKIKILKSEERLYSKKHDFCGTADAIIQIGKKKYLLDYKTSKGLYNEVMLQTASYVKAYEEMHKVKLDGRWVVRFEKRSAKEFKKEMEEKGKVNEEYQIFEAVFLDHEENRVDRDFDAFLNAKGLHEWNKISSKEIKELPRV